MEIVSVLFFSASMTYIGWMFGIAQQIEASEKSTTEAFKEGYIKGYFDGRAAKKEKPYFEDFPSMRIN